MFSSTSHTVPSCNNLVALETELRSMLCCNFLFWSGFTLNWPESSLYSISRACRSFPVDETPFHMSHYDDLPSFIVSYERCFLQSLVVSNFGSYVMPTVGDSSFIHRLDVDIVTPTYTGTDSLGSRTYIDPAYATGLEVLRRTWPQLTYPTAFWWAIWRTAWMRKQKCKTPSRDGIIGRERLIQCLSFWLAVIFIECSLVRKLWNTY